MTEQQDSSFTAEVSVEPLPGDLAKAAIFAWATELPLWKQEAFRLAISGSDPETNAISLAPAALAALNDEPSTILPLTEAEIGVGMPSGGDFQLVEIAEVKNVNRLVAGAGLKFGASGLTSIYGDNGSGKSGFARVLKRGCGARDQESILANVFDDPPSEVASATFVVRSAKGDQPIAWKNDGTAAAPPLSSIPVFDSKTAPFFVERPSSLEFTPYGLDCFENMAANLDATAEHLRSKIRGIDANHAIALVPEQHAGRAEAAIQSLINLADEELDKNLSWHAAHQAKLDELQSAARDPNARVASLAAAADGLMHYTAGLVAASKAISDVAVSATIAATAEAKATRAAAITVAKTEFATETLPGVGSDPWRIMFEAARAYSLSAAYPEKPFPPVEEGDLCLLCQQDISADARKRLQHFEHFVRGTVSVAVEQADAKLGAIRTAVEEARVTFGTLALDPATRGESPKEATVLDQVREALAIRFGEMSSVLGGQAYEAKGLLPETDWEAINARVDHLRTASTQLQALINSGEAEALAEHAAALEAHHALCLVAAAVKSRVTDLRLSAKMETAIASCSTAQVTRRGGELLREFVTDALVGAFNKELKGLEVTATAAQLKAAPKKGAVERSVGLEALKIKASAPNVLSEGEYRAVALAAFFAELSTTSGNAPIVIDDPVSSLDHRRRERVARRLASEALSRQVIVFTHDLPFFLMLEEACKELGAQRTPLYIERGLGGFGAVSSQSAPWDAQKFSERRGQLVERLAKLKKHVALVGEDEEYRNQITAFYDRARKTWERGLEELVFNGAIVRYRRSLETQRLKGVAVDDEIYVAFTAGMTKSSAITGHDQATELGGAWPAPNDAEDILNALVEFEAMAKTKSNHVSKTR